MAATRQHDEGNQAANAGAEHAEWLKRYGEYLTRAAGQSARMLNLYQEFLDHVSRGALSPTALQDLLASFAQARGTAYTAKVSDLSLRFLSGLVEVGTAYFKDLAEAAVPGAGSGEPPPPPPAWDAADPVRSFEQLTEYANQLRDGALDAYQALLRQVASGELSPEEIRQSSSDHLNRRLHDHLRRLGGLYFDLLSELGDVRSEYEEEYLEAVLERARRDADEEASALKLIAPLGETAAASLALQNTRDEPARIRCAVTDVRRADGVGPAFVPQIEISPNVLELPPGQEARLGLSLLLSVADYDPDALYVGALHITRPGDPRVEVPLHIFADGPAHRESGDARDPG